MLRFNLLGPLEVIRNGTLCTPSAPMQRALLALLLLNANTLLPTRRIIDALWRGHPPRSAPLVLQMYVTAVRRALTPPGSRQPDLLTGSVLRTLPAGYGVYVTPEQVDLEQFRTFAASGRRLRAVGRCALAAQAFRRALSLWRGPALADLDRVGAFDPHAVRLEEDRLALLQERIGVDLCQGDAIAVVGELEALVRAHPTSESLCQQLMLALYLTGRRTEALRAYTRIRDAMVDDVGIEPGPGPRLTQRGILGSWPLPETGYPWHSPTGTMVRICDPRTFSGWPSGRPADPPPRVSTAAR